MKLVFDKIKVRNFRGIDAFEFTPDFSKYNYITGLNGVGKTSLFALVARSIDAIKGKDRLFVSRDFIFDSLDKVKKIMIGYEILIFLDKQELSDLRFTSTENPIKCSLKISCADTKGLSKIEFDFTNIENKKKLESFLLDRLSYRVISFNTTLTSRISSNRGESTHAALFDNSQMGYGDGFRAKMIEQLLSTSIGNEVMNEYPNLKSDVLEYVNKLGVSKWREFYISDDKKLFLEKKDGSYQPWDSLSSGERAFFEFAMGILNAKHNNVNFLFVEEPENNINPIMQTNLVNLIKSELPDCHLFINTHNSTFLEDISSADIKHFWFTNDDGFNLNVMDIAQLSFFLKAIGVSANTLGESKNIFYVEGASDAIFFGKIMELISDLKGYKFQLGFDLKFVPIQNIDYFKKRAVFDADKIAGVVNEHFNLCQNGVENTWVLMDGDVDDYDLAKEKFKKLQNSVGQSVNVVIPWYKTLESIYDSKLWSFREKGNKVIYNDKISRSKALWNSPEDNLSSHINLPPKIEMALDIVKNIDQKWVKKYIKEFNELEKILNTIISS